MKAKCKRWWYQQYPARAAAHTYTAHSCTLRYGHTGPHQCHCGDKRATEDINPHKPNLATPHHRQELTRPCTTRTFRLATNKPNLATPTKTRPHMINLHAINQRYETSLNTHTAKGTPTRKAYLALADSVADIPTLLAEIERIQAQLGAVKEIGSKHWNAQIKRESKFGRPGSSCVCEVCKIMRALTEDEQG